MTKHAMLNVKRAAGLLLLCLSFSALGLAKDYPFTASSSVPAARGHVEFNSEKGGNNKVKIRVEHLARPENLTPPRSSYVIWFQERDAGPTIQGILKVDKNLKADFETTTPLKNFTVLITAEDDAAPRSPGGSEILRTTVQQ